MKNLKNKYKFELRLALKNEKDVLVQYLAKRNWEDSLKHRKQLTPKISATEADNFIHKERIILRELIGSKVMVQDYKKFDISIFVFNYIQEFDKNIITSMTCRVLKTKKGMELLEGEDVVFDLKGLQRSAYRKKKDKTGRPGKPKDESIQKTFEIKKYAQENPNITMDEVCKNFGFSKTSYYRVLQWLAHRNN